MKRSRFADQHGLYAVTPDDLEGSVLLKSVAEALAGGASWVQYRAKSRADAETAAAIAGLCRHHHAVFIVNDDPELAAGVEADGVHLGRDDGSIAGARAVLGADRIIGVSCYNNPERAAVLAAEGADYLAFGSMYPSPTKPDAVRCSPQVLTEARGLGRPVAAIGGITLEKAPELVAAGADLLAVISDLFDAPDIKAKAAAYARLFD